MKARFLEDLLKIKNKKDILLRSFLFNLVIIIIFTIFYFLLRDEFTLNYHTKWMKNNRDNNVTFLDCLLTATSVQGRIGITNILPISTKSKILMVIHELVMILSHLFGIIFFILF